MSTRSEIPTIKHQKLPPIKHRPSTVPIDAWKRHLATRATAETRQRKEDALLEELLRSDLFV
jgi:hypothetical protein